LGDPLGQLGINVPFLLSQIVNFGILLIALRIFLWKPLMARLEERREMLRQQQEDAEAVAQARAEIDQERSRILEEARAEANQVLAEARTQARETLEQATSEARQEADELVMQAREDAEEERNRVLGQMREQISALALAAAHKVVGEALDEQRQRALVESFFSGVREGRVEVLPEGMEQLEGPVTVTSALPLKEAEKDTIRDDLAARLGEGVAVRFQVDPQILGGLVVRAGDRVVDGSMAGRLEQLRQSLI